MSVIHECDCVNEQTIQKDVAPTAWIFEEDGAFHVTVWWSGGVDRPCVGGYVLMNREVAERLAIAVNAGAVYGDPEVRTDVDGRTYVRASSRVLGRTASADLKRLGF